MMNNRLAGVLLFVMLALAFAGCSSSIASTPEGAATPTLKGALEVDIVLSDSARSRRLKPPLLWVFLTTLS